MLYVIIKIMSYHIMSYHTPEIIAVRPARRKV
jgi:hypothetical protein